MNDKPRIQSEAELRFLELAAARRAAFEVRKRDISRRKLDAAYLKAKADLGDADGVYGHAILALRRRGDPELEMLARIISSKVTTGVNVRFSRRRGRLPGGENPVECRALIG